MDAANVDQNNFMIGADTWEAATTVIAPPAPKAKRAGARRRARVAKQFEERELREEEERLEREKLEAQAPKEPEEPKVGTKGAQKKACQAEAPEFWKASSPAFTRTRKDRGRAKARDAKQAGTAFGSEEALSPSAA